MVIHVIEDNEGLRTTLCLILTADGFQAEPYASARDFLNCLTRDTRGCVLSDLAMPEITALQMLSEMKKRESALPVIISSGDASVTAAVEAMKMPGVVDFLVKPFETETLLIAVRTALAGACGPRENDDVRSIRGRLASLTPQQHVVLISMISGLQNKMIAAKLGLSPRTVETHRSAIMSKMGAKNLPHLIRMVFVCRQQTRRPEIEPGERSCGEPGGCGGSPQRNEGEFRGEADSCWLWSANDPDFPFSRGSALANRRIR
jgi:two-component system response regulator FixJ